MQIQLWINGKTVTDDINADLLLIDFLRNHGCYSVKRGCDTSNCGLCTVFVEDRPVLSCSMLTARVQGCHVTTLEGLPEEAEGFGAYIADQALFRENPDPTDEEILEYLAGNLCRCSGYEGQMRGIKAYLAYKHGKEGENDA